MKVREVIKIKEWVDGSGYNYEETYSDKLVDVAAEEDVQGDFGWDWWEKVEPATGTGDLRIVAEYHRVRAVENGVKNLVVQPTHLMHGAEYDEMMDSLRLREMSPP